MNFKKIFRRETAVEESRPLTPVLTALTASLPNCLILCLTIFLVYGASPGRPLAADTAKNPPAHVTKVVKESDLTSLTLTPEAEKRLGIVTVKVERKKTARSRTFGGELIMPWSGTNNSASQSGQTIFSILPSLSPTEMVRIAETQVDADAQVRKTEVQLEAAKIALDRATKVMAEKAGSARSVDEAKAQAALAESALTAAKARRDLLGPPILGMMNMKTYWVRVPIYVGDLPRLKLDTEARVGDLASASGPSSKVAKPVSAPPSANAAASTIDLFYAVAGDETFRLGQKVGVAIPVNEIQESLVIPWSSVVHDINGGAWVYEQVGPQAFARKRVQIRSVTGNLAALASGPKEGANIVTEGAAELFGTEFGIGK